MGNSDSRAEQSWGGVRIRASGGAALNEARARLEAQLSSRNLLAFTESLVADATSIRFRLNRDTAAAWAPGCDTFGLCKKLGLDTLNNPGDLDKEILVALLLAPVTLDFPSYDELAAAVRIRRHIVEAARRTALDFHTTEAERPTDYWTYHKDTGFTVIPGKSIIEALVKATQPEVSGKHYSFSCYRATEYVILLAIAQELATSNPALLRQLQSQWERKAIMSGKFHDVFLHEYGTQEDPLPASYYVPGDRVWFRNPDEHSSDVTGYEGSWVIYLGDNLFTNFWKCEKPYTLAAKCLELYHWRDGTWRDAAGELQMNESIVDDKVHQSQADPAAVERILQRMQRLRDPKGVYAEGGCMDTTREFPRWVCPGTSDLVLPGS